MPTKAHGDTIDPLLRRRSDICPSGWADAPTFRGVQPDQLGTGIASFGSEVALIVGCWEYRSGVSPVIDTPLAALASSLREFVASVEELREANDGEFLRGTGRR